MKRLALCFCALVLAAMAKAEDGHQLWLRYQPVNKAQITGPECLAAEELRTYYQGDKVQLTIDRSMPEDAYRISGSTITAKNEQGLLYGAYALLRGEQGYSAPFWKLRILTIGTTPTALWSAVLQERASSSIPIRNGSNCTLAPMRL